MNNLGYACINMSLSERSKALRITTNRTMIKRTYKDRGIEYASELALLNIRDLYTILQWNVSHGIYFYRLSSNILPWASEYDLVDMPNFGAIHAAALKAGNYAREHGIRLTSHPGPFNKLASPKERVYQLTKTDLSVHGDLFDLIGLPRTPYAKLNIHVGAAYGDKPFALDNDSVYKRIGIPIVFDYHHHMLHPGGQSEQEALELALSTWGDIKPVVHYAESRSLEHGNPKIKPQAHSDLVYSTLNDYGNEFDIMIEAKHKEQALLKYRKNIESLAAK